MSFITEVYKFAGNSTVFSLANLSLVSTTYTGTKLNSAIKYLVKNKNLIRLSKGLYSLNDNYSRQEFANKYRVPSYVSLYTVLFESGIVFQPYDSIFLLSRRSETKNINGINIIYKNIKDEILFNPLGITNEGNICKATPERAICDTLYLFGNQYFDNLRSVNFEVIKEINKDVYNNNKAIQKWIQENTKQI